MHVLKTIVSVCLQVNAQLRFAPEAKISSRCSAITMQVHDEVMNDWYGCGVGRQADGHRSVLPGLADRVRVR
jgi:hypothetical protein